MQTLGLSDTTPRSESRLRALFWPTIRNSADLDYITLQGFWICAIVGILNLLGTAVSLLSPVSAGMAAAAAFESLFYLFAGMGVRQRDKLAALSAFVAYFLATFVMQKYYGTGFSVPRIILTALLLANIRGIWLAARWRADSEEAFEVAALDQTLSDKLANRLPSFLWPKVRYLFYVMAVVVIAFLLLALAAPTASRLTPA